MKQWTFFHVKSFLSFSSEQITVELFWLQLGPAPGLTSWPPWKAFHETAGLYGVSLETSDLVLSLQAFPELTKSCCTRLVTEPWTLLCMSGGSMTGIKTTQSLGSGCSGMHPGPTTHKLCGLRHVTHIEHSTSSIRWS